MPRISRDGVSLHYEFDRAAGEHEADAEGGSASTAGGASATPVVFVQGMGYGRWMWRWQREALREHDMIAPDTRGTDRSEAGLPPLVSRLPARLRRPLLGRALGYSVASLAADLEAVLDDVGVRRAHLVGASLGGTIVQCHAIEYDRAESLTLCCTTPGGPDAVPTPDDIRERIFHGPGGASKRELVRDRMRPAFTEAFTNRNPHLMDRIVEWRVEGDADDPALEAQARALSAFDVHDRLDEIHVPTLVLHGTDDRVVPVENAALLSAGIPDSRLERIEGGSHCFFIEEADRVNETLRGFLAETG